MYNIAIIGAGQLGSRHLQGLKLAKLPMRIYVVDNNENSLQIAKERYEQVEDNPLIEQIKFVGTIDELPPMIDLAIVATGSLPRRAILEGLLAKKTVKNLLLEKVLFPSLSDYPAMSALLGKNNLSGSTWVNCPRRLFEGYKKLREELRGKQNIRYEKTGSDWGMGCNSIHFIDHFAFLTGDKEFSPMDTSGLDKTIHESKRPGYVEFTGTVSGTTNTGNSLSLCSTKKPGQAQFIRIYGGADHYDIDEASDHILKNDTPWGNVGMKYQSTLTNIVAEQILTDSRCELTEYAESAKLHLAFLEPLVQFYNEITQHNEDYCPIT